MPCLRERSICFGLMAACLLACSASDSTSSQIWDRTFLRFDANQSGALDLQEWKASGISGTEKLAFESYDLDRDGEISGAEFSTILTAW